MVVEGATMTKLIRLNAGNYVTGPDNTVGTFVVYRYTVGNLGHTPDGWMVCEFVDNPDAPGIPDLRSLDWVRTLRDAVEYLDRYWTR
jgi:hypothetical protein